jgi:hypothetical protein
MLHTHFYGRFLIQKDKPAKPGNLPKRNDRSEIEERSADKYFHFSSSFQTVNIRAVTLVYKIYPGSAVLYNSVNSIRPNYTSSCSQARDFTTPGLYQLWYEFSRVVTVIGQRAACLVAAVLYLKTGCLNRTGTSHQDRLPLPSPFHKIHFH